MTSASPQEITRLLSDWSRGDKAALDKLTPLVYAELRQIARRQMGRERPGHTLQPTALVNEAYLKIAGQGGFEWQNRAHFFAVCAQVMRHILVDHARTHARDKRGGGAVHVALEDVSASVEARATDMVALDEALRTLETLDPQKARIIELRYFGGLGVDEVAEILKISPATIGREWRRAKAWLYQELQKD